MINLIFINYEIQKYLGNRPKMFPVLLVGTVILNLSLINEESLWEIEKINNVYSKKVKDEKTIAKNMLKENNPMIHDLRKSH